MELIKRLFCFNDDDSSVIGLCKFNDEFYKLNDAKERVKKRLNKESSLTQILKRHA